MVNLIDLQAKALIEILSCGLGAEASYPQSYFNFKGFVYDQAALHIIGPVLKMGNLTKQNVVYHAHIA